MGDMMQNGVESLVSLPGKIPDLWNAAFGDGPRKADSPMGVVGAARIGGDVFTLDIPASQQVAMMLLLVAGFNLSCSCSTCSRCSRSTAVTSRARCGSRCGGTRRRC